MTNTDYPWEPPLAGTETEHLIGALDRLRTTFRWKADDLDATALQTRVNQNTIKAAVAGDGHGGIIGAARPVRTHGRT